VNTKANGIPLAPEMSARPELAGRRVVWDALSTQDETAKVHAANVLACRRAFFFHKYAFFAVVVRSKADCSVRSKAE